jgi:hypothetical protein
MAAKKKTSSPTKRITKTAFVKSLPKDTPAKEVVEKAMAHGIEISEGYVYEIRSAAKRPKKGGKATSRTTAPKKSTSKRGPTKGAATSKRGFIESLPASTPVAEVVAAAKKAGLAISNNYVYFLRSGSKKKTKALGKHSPAKSNDGSVEARFVDLALDVGLARAEEMLRSLRAKVRSIVL